jgi:2,6-dihydroxypseudooxynicotine hydrolase
VPVTVKDTLTFAMGATSHADARQRAAAFTLAGALKHLTCPMLVVHSGRDAVVPVEESERIRAEASGPASLVVFPEGNHVCDNIPYKVRPLMADWMAETLGA